MLQFEGGDTETWSETLKQKPGMKQRFIIHCMALLQILVFIMSAYNMIIIAIEPLLKITNSTFKCGEDKTHQRNLQIC